MLDIEYYIYKAAYSFQRGASDVEVTSMLCNDGLLEEEIFLVIQAGAILAGDWAFIEADEIPTRPDGKAIKRIVKTM